jgi:hypothetical protein
MLRAGGAAAFGSVTVSTPSAKSADTSSVAIFDPNSNVLANAP